MTPKKCEYNDGYKMTVVGLKEYFESRLNALDRLLEVKFDAAKSSSDASFKSAETALQKAETGQLAFNLRTNEFRQALSDGQTLMLSRSEFAILHKAMDDKIEKMRMDIAQLREFTSGETSKDTQSASNRLQQNWAADNAVAIVAVIIAAAAVVLHFVH